MVKVKFLFLFVLFSQWSCSQNIIKDKVEKIIIHTAPFLVIEENDTILIHPIYGYTKDTVLKSPYRQSYIFEKKQDISNILKLCNQIKKGTIISNGHRFNYKIIIEGYNKKNKITFSIGVQNCGSCILEEKYIYECNKDFVNKLNIYVPNLNNVIPG